MTAHDDLIRRSDAEAAIHEVARRPRSGDVMESARAAFREAVEAIRALPADPVAEAAGNLAEATEAHETAARVMDHAMDAWRAAPVHRRHELGLVADNAIELKARAERAYHVALHAYRAAVAARAAGTVSLAPAPAPSSGCHNDKPGDPCPCGANFERCPPAGTPPDGIVWPAPARPPAVRVPTPEEIAAMPLEQVAAETARLKRETGAVGGISRCEPAPACARCVGSGIAYDDGGGMERTSVTISCPDCRGTP